MWLKILKQFLSFLATLSGRAGPSRLDFLFLAGPSSFFRIGAEMIANGHARNSVVAVLALTKGILIAARLVLMNACMGAFLLFRSPIRTQHSDYPALALALALPFAAAGPPLPLGAAGPALALTAAGPFSCNLLIRCDGWSCIVHQRKKTNTYLFLLKFTREASELFPNSL